MYAMLTTGGGRGAPGEGRGARGGARRAGGGGDEAGNRGGFGRGRAGGAQGGEGEAAQAEWGPPAAAGGRDGYCRQHAQHLTRSHVVCDSTRYWRGQ
jgi:hypothetical protein